MAKLWWKNFDLVSDTKSTFRVGYLTAKISDFKKLVEAVRAGKKRTIRVKCYGSTFRTVHFDGKKVYVGALGETMKEWKYFNEYYGDTLEDNNVCTATKRDILVLAKKVTKLTGQTI